MTTATSQHQERPKEKPTALQLQAITEYIVDVVSDTVGHTVISKMSRKFSPSFPFDEGKFIWTFKIYYSCQDLAILRSLNLTQNHIHVFFLHVFCRFGP